MALTHNFYTIGKKNNETIEIKVIISDDLILYINDSLKWFNTIWANSQENQGLDYHGVSIIQDKNVILFKMILGNWIGLFNNAPERFILTGDYLYDEDNYEQIEIDKEQLIKQLTSLINLCEYALENNINIIHEGI